MNHGRYAGSGVKGGSRTSVLRMQLMIEPVLGEMSMRVVKSIAYGPGQTRTEIKLLPEGLEHYIFAREMAVAAGSAFSSRPETLQMCSRWAWPAACKVQALVVCSFGVQNPT